MKIVLHFNYSKSSFFFVALTSRNSRGLSNRSEKSELYAKIAMDVVALGAQTTGFVLWPLLEKERNPTELMIIPITLFLVSCGYWENYITKHSLFGL